MLISVHTNTLLVRRKHEQKLYFYGGKKKYKNTGTAWPQVSSMPGCELNVLGTNQSLDSYQSYSMTNTDVTNLPEGHTEGRGHLGGKLPSACAPRTVMDS